jgi:SIR2-like domain/Domain of unknown function (DUF4020)
MFFGGVDIPDELIQAQATGNLVVFAGSGVSMDPPSALPNYDELAKKLGNTASIQRSDYESTDRYLGRLADQNVPVHVETKKIVTATSSKPNHYHKDLIALFSSEKSLKIVTTNWDTHFSTISKSQELVDKKNVFAAPALPIGTDFSGIVYLHGSADGDPMNMVLTDRDFSKAYITQGYARRFILELFKKCVVLFIGYSHNDTVLTYLARGLPSDEYLPRYAFFKDKEQSERQKWEDLGIIPCAFHDYSTQSKAVSEWADWSTRTFIDEEVRLKHLLEKPSKLSLNQQEVSDLSYCIKDKDKRQFFFRYAKSVEWLKWMDQQGYLSLLFQQNPTDSDLVVQTADWLTKTFIPDYEQDIYEIIQKHLKKSGNIHSQLWYTIARNFAYGSEISESQILARWTLLLLNNIPEYANKELLAQIVLKCKGRESQATAITLLDFLTRPNLKWEKSFSSYLADSSEEKKFKERFTPKIFIEVKEYHINKAWDSIFKPHLVDYAEPILRILIHQIESAYLMLESAHGGNLGFDSLSFARSAIEQHEQNRGFGELDHIINFTRDVLDWLIENNLETAKGYTQSLLDSQYFLLQRIGLYILTHDLKTSPDKKIRTVLQRNWLYSSELHHEVFVLLRNSYSESSQPIRKRLLKAILKGRKLQKLDAEEVNLRDYSIYKRLNWLADSDPQCKLVKEEVSKIQKQNPEFKPQIHPDLTHWTGPTKWGFESPKTAKDLLNMPVPDAAAYINDFKGEPYGDYNELREGLFRVGQVAIKEDPEWGIGLLQELKNLENLKADYWNTLLFGFSEATLSANHWSDLLTFLLNTHELFLSCIHTISSILADSHRNVEGTIPIDSIPVALDIADSLFKVATSDSFKQSANAIARNDWLNTAINHPAGKIVEFWILAMDQTLKYDKIKKPYIPEKYKRVFDDVLKMPDGISELGIAVIFRQLRWFYALDQEWTKKRLLPLMKWEKSSSHAIAAWDGYLYSRGWTQAMLSEILPYYTSFFGHLTDNFGSSFHQHFCENIASIAIWGEFNPLHDNDGWLVKFIRNESEESKKLFSNEIIQLLKQQSLTKKGELWTEWIKEYWETRLESGLILSAEEAGEMISWALNLEPVFEEAVDYVLRGPKPVLEHSQIFYDLDKHNTAEKYEPLPLARLLDFILKAPSKPFFFCDNTVVVFKNHLNVPAVDSKILHDICDSLAKLGCSKALELDNSIRSD